MTRKLALLGLGCVLAALIAAPVSAGGGKTDDGVMRLHLIWTNDVHGHIVPEPARFMNPAFPPPLGGGYSAATYIQEIRRQAEKNGEPVLLMDVGDIFQGTPIGNKTQGEAVVQYFNAMGYKLVVPGNHDFDKGRKNTERLARMSDCPWLSANIIEKSTGRIPDWLTPTMMLDFQGIKIGVIGITTPSTAVMSFPENIKGLEFEPMPPVIEKYRDQLKAQGADLILLAIHEGLPYDPKKGWERIAGRTETETAQEQQGTYGSNYSHGGMNLMELVNTVAGIDIAVGGHTHRGYYDPWIDPVHHTMCFETFGNGSSVGHVILKIDRRTRELIGYERADSRGTLITLFEDEIWPDEKIEKVLKPYRDEAEAEMGRVVGSTKVALGRGGPGANLVGNLVTDAMREYFDADFSFQNLGGLRADLPAGDLTSRDIFSVLPFGNELVVVEMDGRMLRRVLERKVAGRSGGICVSGVEWAFDKTRPDYDRGVKLLIGGEPWDPDRVYKVVCTNFLMEGNSGLDFLTSVPADKITPTQITTQEAVEHYLKLHSPVRPRVDDRWVEVTGVPQAPYLAKPYMP